MSRRKLDLVHTSIQLRPDQHAALQREADRRGTSMSQIVREALTHFLTRESTNNRLQNDTIAVGAP
jgi:predicted transcriptional regulator